MGELQVLRFRSKTFEESCLDRKGVKVSVGWFSSEEGRGATKRGNKSPSS